MSKKKSGLLIAFGAMLGGAVAAGISYYLKLKSFNDELDQDFHEYEEEETPSGETAESSEPAPERTYITINSGKDTESSDESDDAEDSAPEAQECPADADADTEAEDETQDDVPVKGSDDPEEKTSSVVVEDDTEEEKTE